MPARLGSPPAARPRPRPSPRGRRKQYRRRADDVDQEQPGVPVALQALDVRAEVEEADRERREQGEYADQQRVLEPPDKARRVCDDGGAFDFPYRHDCDSFTYSHMHRQQNGREANLPPRLLTTTSSALSYGVSSADCEAWHERAQPLPRPSQLLQEGSRSRARAQPTPQPRLLAGQDGRTAAPYPPPKPQPQPPA